MNSQFILDKHGSNNLIKFQMQFSLQYDGSPRF